MQTQLELGMEQKTNPLLVKRMAEKDRALAYTLQLSPKAREVKMCRRGSAAEALGKISHDMERYIFSKGQFSVIEFLHAMTEQTGPVHSIISTWTAHGGDIAEAHSFMESGRLLSSRWMVDFTFQRRKPHFCGQLRTLFGLDAIRVTQTHAKFICLWNDKWNLTLLTSANLNRNARNENFLVRESEELLTFHRDFIDGVWAKKSKEEIMEPSAKVHKQNFTNDE